MNENILVTGSTGLLGSYLLGELIEYNVGCLTALSRGETQKEAESRIFDELGKHLSIAQRRRIFHLVKVIRGDIIEKKLGLSDNTYNDLSKEITSIYHCAALCKFNVPSNIIRGVNVQGTENILKFALLCQKNRQFKTVHHISTIAVAGDSNGVFYETDLDVGQEFNNTYEQSKFEAEKLVNKYRAKGLPITIYRPGVIIGDSITGYTNNFEMIYRPLQMFFMELFNEIPGERSSFYYFVPVDYVAKAIIRVSFNESSCNSTFHIISGDYITLGKFIDVASKYFNFKKPSFVPKRKFNFKQLSPFQLNMVAPYIPYFSYRLRYDSRQTQAILSSTNFEWPKINDVFLRRLFKYCIQCKFIVPKKKFSLGILPKL